MFLIRGSFSSPSHDEPLTALKLSRSQSTGMIRQCQSCVSEIPTIGMYHLVTAKGIYHSLDVCITSNGDATTTMTPIQIDRSLPHFYNSIVGCMIRNHSSYKCSNPWSLKLLLFSLTLFCIQLISQNSCVKHQDPFPSY